MTSDDAIAGAEQGLRSTQSSDHTGSDVLNTAESHSGTQEVVGIFGSYAALCAAAHDLYRAGFKHWDVMRDAGQEGARAGLPAADLADDPGARRTDHIHVELVHETAGYMIGTFAVLPGIGAAWATAGAGAGTTRTLVAVILIGGGGAIVGALVSAAMARFTKSRLVARAASGGLVLWAHAKSVEQETAALRILQRHDAHNVHARPAHDF